MIGRVLLTAVLAGLIAGLVLSGIQYLRLTPLILAAETHETAHEDHDHGAGEWAPAPGAERLGYTTVASMLTGAGFAAMLAGISLMANVPINQRNGLIWGLSGFIAVHVATSAGLPPLLPGMPEADLLSRQVWWAATVLATGIGIYFIAIRREAWAPFAAVILIALPHVIGAPQASNSETSVPPALAATFASNAIAAAAVFWSVLGLLLGYFLPRFTEDEDFNS